MKTLTRSLIAIFACTGLALTTFAGPEALPTRDSKDKEVMAAPAPTCDYNWTGFYIGLNAGYGWGNADTDFTALDGGVAVNELDPTKLEPDPDGFVGGAQIGYNHQWNWLVLGAEVDFQGSDMDGRESASPIFNPLGGGASYGPGSFIEARENTDWFGTARLRVGFAPFCRLLVYGTGGLAYGNVHYAGTTDPNLPIYATSFDRTKVGWTAGGGLEFALTHRWSMKVEYLYYDLGDESATANPVPPNPGFQVHYHWDTTANLVRGGINFKF